MGNKKLGNILILLGLLSLFASIGYEAAPMATIEVSTPIVDAKVTGVKSVSALLFITGVFLVSVGIVLRLES